MMQYNEGSYSNYPLQAYNPMDMTGEEMMAMRARLGRQAGWDGLRGDAAEEAVDLMFHHWITRDYAGAGIPRGDHARAIASILCYARRSHWHGFTGQRRQVRGKRAQRGSDGKALRQSVAVAGLEEMAYQARRMASLVAPPSQLSEDLDDMENRPFTERARRCRKLAGEAGQSVAEWLAEAEGQQTARAHYAPALLADQPGPWLECMTSKRPQSRYAFAAAIDGYREAVAAYHAAAAAAPDYVGEAAAARAELKASRKAKADGIRAARGAR